MGKQVKIDENALTTLIMESVKKVLNERYLDIVDSGVADYQGTGSKESDERMKQIRKRRQAGDSKSVDPTIERPGKSPYFKYDKNGFITNTNHNDSTWSFAKKSFGGNGGSKVCDPVTDYATELVTKSDSEPIKELARELINVCLEWEMKYNKKNP